MIRTGFEETTLGLLTIDESQTEYKPFVDAFMAAMQQASSQSSGPIIVAQKIYEAVTDNTDQMRYIAGADAEQIIAARKQMNDPEYLGMIRAQFGLASKEEVS